LKGHYKSALIGAFLWVINTSVHIYEITQRLPAFIARIRLHGQVITTTISAGNPAQARELLAHLYGAKNVLTVVAA
jgi:hypothetical protein